MNGPCAESKQCQVIFHNDDETPESFVVDLLQSVFRKPLGEALHLTVKIGKQGHASCGSYSRDDARALLRAARAEIRAAGHPLRITSDALAEDGEINEACKICGAPAG